MKALPPAMSKQGGGLAKFIGDPNAITKAIEFAIENHKSDKISSWCITAKEHIASNFTIEKMLDKLEDYFHYQYALDNRK